MTTYGLDLRKDKYGRFTSYHKEMADFICEEMIEEGLPLVHFLKKYKKKENYDLIPKKLKLLYPEFPSRATIYRWLVAQPYFRDKLSQARAQIAEDIAEKILDHDVTTYTDKDGIERADAGRVALMKARLRRDSVFVSMMAPHLRPNSSGDAALEKAQELKEELEEIKSRLKDGAQKEY